MDIYASAFLVMLLWGLQPILQKHLVNQLPQKMVMILTGTAYFSSLLIFGLMNNKELQVSAQKVTSKHILTAIVSAGLCSFLGNILFYKLLSVHDAHFVSAFTSAFPVMTMVFAFLLLKENITKLSAVGIIFVSLGLWMMAMGKNKPATS